MCQKDPCDIHKIAKTKMSMDICAVWSSSWHSVDSNAGPDQNAQFSQIWHKDCVSFVYYIVVWFIW